MQISENKKVKNDPKSKSKSKVRIQGTIEKKSWSTTTWVVPKTVLNPTYKKVVQLHE